MLFGNKSLYQRQISSKEHTEIVEPVYIGHSDNDFKTEKKTSDFELDITPVVLRQGCFD